MHLVENRAFKGTVYGLIQFIVTFIQSILLVPLLLTVWGQEKYGLYILVFTFIQLLKAIDFGLQTFVGNEFTREYYVDNKRAGIIISSGILMAFILGGLEFFLFAILWKTGIVYSILNVPHGSNDIMWGILAMVFMWWIVGAITGIMTRAVVCKGLYPKTILWGIYLKFLEILMLLLAGLTNLSISGMLFAWAGINFIYLGLVLRWTMDYLKEFKIYKPFGSLKEGVQMLKKSSILTINNIFDQVSGNGIVFLISRFISISVIPVFITLRTITNTVLQFNSLLVNPLQPELIRYHAERSVDKIFSVFQAVWIINGLIINISLLLIIPFIREIYMIWTKNILPFNENLYFLLCTSAALVNYGKILTTYLFGINDVRAISYISFSRFFVLFIVSLISIKYYGVMGIGIGFLFSELVSSVIIPIYLTKKNLKILNDKKIAWNVILSMLPIGVLVGCFVMELCTTYSSIFITIIGAIIIIIVYILQWFKLESSVQLRLKSFVIQLYHQK